LTVGVAQSRLQAEFVAAVQGQWFGRHEPSTVRAEPGEGAGQRRGDDQGRVCYRHANLARFHHAHCEPEVEVHRWGRRVGTRNQLDAPGAIRGLTAGVKDSREDGQDKKLGGLNSALVARRLRLS
jgi:hypothetical protein